MSIPPATRQAPSSYPKGFDENTAQLRDELGTPLQLTRNEPGLDDLAEDAVQLIASFRHGITLWCQQAVRASTAYTASLPTLDQLTTPHNNHVVDAWRCAAKAAALGEHDFPAGPTYGHLTDAQCMTVLKDAAEVTRALVDLDRRHAASAAWEPIEERDLLGRAAVVCAAHSPATSAPIAASIIAAGARDQRIGTPRVDLSAGGAVKQQRSRHIPLDAPPGAPVLAMVKKRLMPTPAEPPAPAGTSLARAAFTQRVEPSQHQAPTAQLPL